MGVLMLVHNPSSEGKFTTLLLRTFEQSPKIPDYWESSEFADVSCWLEGVKRTRYNLKQSES
jgi:hypothetical protein